MGSSACRHFRSHSSLFPLRIKLPVYQIRGIVAAEREWHSHLALEERNSCCEVALDFCKKWPHASTCLVCV